MIVFSGFSTFSIYLKPNWNRNVTIDGLIYPFSWFNYSKISEHPFNSPAFSHKQILTWNSEWNRVLLNRSEKTKALFSIRFQSWTEKIKNKILLRHCVSLTMFNYSHINISDWNLSIPHSVLSQWISIVILSNEIFFQSMNCNWPPKNVRCANSVHCGRSFLFFFFAFSISLAYCMFAVHWQ